MRILLVEDDTTLGDVICAALKKAGNAVDWVKDGQAALQGILGNINGNNSKTPSPQINTDKFDVIILDLGLPKVDGLTVLEKIRQNNIHTPVMILTARDTLEDRVKGLDSGSDDYLVKPFELDELSARLRVLQRRALGRIENLIKYKNLSLDPASHTLSIDNQQVNVPRREYAILQKLLENIGHVVTREALAQTLYGWNEEVDSNTLEVHIHNLRKKLGLDFIRTIRGVGYMIEKEP